MTTVHGNEWWKKTLPSKKTPLALDPKVFLVVKRLVSIEWTSTLFGRRVRELQSPVLHMEVEVSTTDCWLSFKKQKVGLQTWKVRKSVLNIEPGEWMNVVFIKQKSCSFLEAKKNLYPENFLTSKELWSVQKVKNQHGWVSMSLLLHSLFCTVSKLENGLRFQRRGARKWAPISVILAKPSNMAILVSTPIGPRSESNTPHEIAYVQIGAGFLFGAPKLQSPCSRLMPQKGWGPTSERLSSFFVLFGTDKIYLHLFTSRCMNFRIY